MACVGGYSAAQKLRFTGVIITANRVALAVKVTERARFPPAKEVIKLEIFPPGQAATRIIPRAILGMGFIRRTSKKVRKGNARNWQTTPISTGRGFLNKALKSDTLICSATPNIINARILLRIQSVSVEKSIRAASRVELITCFIS
jgi:hypothetical protein